MMANIRTQKNECKICLTDKDVMFFVHKTNIFYKFFHPKHAKIVKHALESKVCKIVDKKISEECKKNNVDENKINGSKTQIQQQALKKVRLCIVLARIMRITTYINSRKQMYEQLAKTMNNLIVDSINAVINDMTGFLKRKQIKVVDEKGKEYIRYV
jgi:hypothetical protein